MAYSPLILLVEDDKMLSSILKGGLEHAGFAVEHARDGNEAIEKLRSLSPSLMLLDLIIPGKDGFEVLEERSTNPQLNKPPVFVFSNLDQENDMSRAKDLGAAEYFVKANTAITVLIEEIRKYLNT